MSAGDGLVYEMKADLDHPRPTSVGRPPNAAERRLGATGRISEIGMTALAEARRKAGAEVAARVLAESKKPLTPRQVDVATRELMRRRPDLSYTAARKFVREVA